jgi:hypothetical protein
MPTTEHGNPDLIRQHKKKGEMGDRALAQKPGKSPPTRPDPKDRTPPRKDDPEQVENVPGRDEKRSHAPDPDEQYRTGRQGRI